MACSIDGMNGPYASVRKLFPRRNLRWSRPLDTVFPYQYKNIITFASKLPDHGCGRGHRRQGCWEGLPTGEFLRNASSFFVCV